jgi:hypothetical protein
MIAAKLDIMAKPLGQLISLLCFVGRHRPSSASFDRRAGGGYRALCEYCGCPLEREDKGRWHASEPTPRR